MFCKLMLLPTKNFSKDDPSLATHCYRHHISHRGDGALLNFRLTLVTDTANCKENTATLLNRDSLT